MEESIFNEAVDALHEHLMKHSLGIFEEPEESLSEIDDEYVYLSNNSTTFGKYEIATGLIIMDEDE